MERRARLEGFSVDRGMLRIKGGWRDVDFPWCPICSPLSAIPRAAKALDKMIRAAAVRDGFTAYQAEELLRFAAGGCWAWLTRELKAKKPVAPGPTGRQQRVRMDVLTYGLNRVIYRILGAVPFHGHGDPTIEDDGRSMRLILSALPSVIPLSSHSPRRLKSELNQRSMEGQRAAEMAIRWVRQAPMKKGEYQVADFVREFYRPCGKHRAKIDELYYAWNSEDRRMRSGVPTQGRRRGAPMAAARVVDRVQPSVLDDLIEREEQGERVL
jgi:hypothetical protein